MSLIKPINQVYYPESPATEFREYSKTCPVPQPSVTAPPTHVVTGTQTLSVGYGVAPDGSITYYQQIAVTVPGSSPTLVYSPPLIPGTTFPAGLTNISTVNLSVVVPS